MKRSSLVLASFMCAMLHSSASNAAANTSDQGGTPDDLDKRIHDLITKVKHSLRPIKGGTFEMGDWGTESGRPWDMDPDSRPVHKVTLDSFSMMAYQVTYDDFDVFTDATGKERVNMAAHRVSDRSPRRPVGVSWYGAKAYCEWLAAKTDLGFDLPTEAQWEFAARSRGKRMLYSTDNGLIERGRNFPREWQHGEKEPPMPDVGSYPPNPVGLYGMSEDTSEWVNDWYDENYYKVSPRKNPVGPAAGTKKVKRGSVGGMAEGSAIVFLRNSAIPQPLRDTYPNGFSYELRVPVPLPGYSGYSDNTFRCAVNATRKATSRIR